MEDMLGGKAHCQRMQVVRLSLLYWASEIFWFE